MVKEKIKNIGIFLILAAIFCRGAFGAEINFELSASSNSISVGKGAELYVTFSNNEIPGKIGAVGTLKRSYVRDGADALGRSLLLIKNSFGDAGFESRIIDGFGLICNRYNGVLDGKAAAIALSKTNGGPRGLLNMAEALHIKTGQLKYQCVAAAAVNVINRDRTGKSKLVSWFKE